MSRVTSPENQPGFYLLAGWSANSYMCTHGFAQGAFFRNVKGLPCAIFMSFARIASPIPAAVESDSVRASRM